MKKSMKFVLAALALLAITGLLALSGCKNDSVPETPAAKLVSISVTPPAQTVYSVGQSFDPTGMVVIATYNDGESKDVTDLAATNFGTVVAEKGLGKEVTVSYTEGETTQPFTFTFTVDVASYQFTETVEDYEYPAGESGTMTGGTYKKFGDWPQTIKDKDVTVGKNTMTRGGMDFHVGSDGNYYVKITAKPYEDTYTYSDGNLVEKDKEVYFKVEPIVWRVLTTSYKAPEGGTAGNALLLAEKILTGGIQWADSSNDYMQSYIRQWLNGNSGTGETSDYNGDAGFLQTAFTQSDWELIADTSVDNSPGKGTTDKIFLLSEQEATTSVYGFAAEGIEDSTRIRDTTDYAKATGAEQSSSVGWWWLRSPHSYHGDFVRVIDRDGDATSHYNFSRADGGVVPALSISLQ